MIKTAIRSLNMKHLVVSFVWGAAGRDSGEWRGAFYLPDSTSNCTVSHSESENPGQPLEWLAHPDAGWEEFNSRRLFR